MPKPYLLSICIPTYNREVYLKRLLDSIVMQKGFTDEVSIVLNDGPSKDNTTEMVQEYQEKYKNISYYRNDTAVGMLPAILESIDMSNGIYTWLLGSDDFMQEDSLSIVLDIIREKSPTVILSNRLMVDGAGEADEYGETGKKTRFFHGFSDFSIYLGLKEDQKYQDKWNYMTFMSVFCFQTAHYQEMLGYVKDNICTLEILKKHYFNYIVIIFSQLFSEKLICVVENPRLIFCQSDNTGWQPNYKIVQDLKMLINYLGDMYSITTQCRNIFRRMYTESFIYERITYRISKIRIFQKAIKILIRNPITKSVYQKLTKLISGSK